MSKRVRVRGRRSGEGSSQGWILVQWWLVKVLGWIGVEQVFEQAIDFVWDGGQVEVFSDERRGVALLVQVPGVIRYVAEILVGLEDGGCFCR